MSNEISFEFKMFIRFLFLFMQCVTFDYLYFTFSSLRTTTVPKQSVVHIIYDKISL